MTEFALVAPLFFMVLFGIIVFGLAIFFQEQVTNAAREGARFAAIHSGTSTCPTSSNLDPDPAYLPLPNSWSNTCDPPSSRWPWMTAHARSKVFGLGGSVQVTACWSGYWTKDSFGGWAAHDQVATDPITGMPNAFRECTVRVFGWSPGQDPSSVASSLQVINPRTRMNAADQYIAIDCSKQFPLTTNTDDMASNWSSSYDTNANQVTVVTCYAWDPPLSGFLLIPKTHHIVGVITEALEYQQ